MTLSHLLTKRDLSEIYRNHQMKMIGHQAPDQNVSMRQYVSPDLFEKKQVVLSVEKDHLGIISTIEYMIDLAVGEVHN